MSGECISPQAARDTALDAAGAKRDVVREAWDAWLRGDVNDMFALLHPEITCGPIASPGLA